MKTSVYPRLLKRLKCRWVRLVSGTRLRTQGPGHRVEIDEALLYGVRIEISGRDNHLTIGPHSRLWGTVIQLRGENLRCSIGANCRLRHCRMAVEDESSLLTIGSDTSGTGSTLLVAEGGLVQIGQDCMMSAGADIRNTDAHSVIDEATGQRTNPAADVRLDDHVWIGLKAQVLKGVHVGTHSIVAAGCVVVRDVPSHTIVAGIPARPVRTGITWKRERVPAAAMPVAVDV